MRACDGQAEQSGLFGAAIAGSDGQPAVTMRITETFSAAELFQPCP